MELFAELLALSKATAVSAVMQIGSNIATEREQTRTVLRAVAKELLNARYAKTDSRLDERLFTQLAIRSSKRLDTRLAKRSAALLATRYIF